VTAIYRALAALFARLASRGEATTPVVVPSPDAVQLFAAHDENLLERSLSQWQFGDWDSLCAIGGESLQHHPERARIALLVAAGYQARGDTAETQNYVRLALKWGANKRLASQLLIAGVYNTLGRAAVARGEETRAQLHFHTAVTLGTPGSDTRLLSQARCDEQLQQLGLDNHSRKQPGKWLPPR